MKKLLVLVLLLFLLTTPANAFTFGGKIDDECSFRNFKLSNDYVTVEIENDSDKRIYFFADLYFVSLFDEVMGHAYIHGGYIPAGGSVKCRARAHNNGTEKAKDAYDIEWQRIK